MLVLGSKRQNFMATVVTGENTSNANEDEKNLKEVSKVSKVNSVKFKTKPQKDCYKKITPWIKELFGEIAVIDNSIPLFSIPFRSAIAHVIVNPWYDDAVITTRAYVVSGANLTPDLLYFLLRKNVSMRFGAFGIDEDKEIVFEHNIVGSTCDKEELNASIVEVMRMADKYDDEIMVKWGGKRAIDLIK